MRKYDDPVEVSRGWIAGSAMEGPAQFLWRGRVWKVKQVLTSWVETGHWWAAHSAGDLLDERELWRVEAGRPDGSARARTPHSEPVEGVFDLVFSWTDGSWRLVSCLD